MIESLYDSYFNTKEKLKFKYKFDNIILLNINNLKYEILSKNLEEIILLSKIMNVNYIISDNIYKISFNNSLISTYNSLLVHNKYLLIIYNKSSI